MDTSASIEKAPEVLLPRPTNPILKAFLKGPILLWRLGLGPLVGRHLLILTTTGRKSGLPRRTVVGFHERQGRKYVYTARGPNTDWYRNILADPHTTIQTAQGHEHVTGRRVTENSEFGKEYASLAHDPILRRWAQTHGVALSRELFITHKDEFILLTFDPTTEPTPPPLPPDLAPLWLALLASGLLGWLVQHFTRGQRHLGPAPAHA